MGVVGKIDRGQRRRSVIGFPLAVVYKFFDDQGNYLAAILTFYAFLSIFPLLLLATSILGFFLEGRPALQEQVLDSALAQFPIIGDQLGRPGGLQGSTGGIIVGALTALYGALGLGLALQNVQSAAWAVPRNSRPNPIMTRVNSLFILFGAGTAILGLSIGSAVLTETDLVGELSRHSWFHWMIRLLTVVVLGLGMTALLRVAAARAIRDRGIRAAPGGFTIAVLWQLLQWIGTVYVTNVIASASRNSMTEVFGVVLGLMGLLYIGAIIGVLGIEVNVVIARKLWPRALLTPFTDSVDLTEADRRAYAMYAQMQRHKGFETVSVRFDGRDGDTHEIVLDPRTEKVIKQHIPGAPPRPEAAHEPTLPMKLPPPAP
ncbi:YihY/virulence factor BrkB family protein [Nocardioides sp. zg-536]|uniref:YihY/virulence factor BrkB family protein n=1 Tax=Nocardioides faecalis TaxID=2803858 RepID=A0A938Y5X7_9ACTN|nr:YihY/virulence factor BrkB family protein [Nocardioides faecalis]MBM9459845.1 YihY/virulence factor BrkB family protein [Nocardioides faecalis]MBS4754476.1 YihY/virulence factor BrkB family protein [Nocardioides faecalis]QVI58915.1 YihY/virulence factor BrkB family protein [Nocardioides faecalis]